jgi:hypothetical protein
MLHVRQRDQILGPHLRRNSQPPVAGDRNMEYPGDVVQPQTRHDIAACRVDYGNFRFGLASESAWVGIDMGDINARTARRTSHPTRAPGRYQAALVAPAMEVDNRYIAADAVPCV